jgi:hypothetical protein
VLAYNKIIALRQVIGADPLLPHVEFFKVKHAFFNALNSQPSTSAVMQTPWPNLEGNLGRPFVEPLTGPRFVVISRGERNFADATLPGIYVDRDHHRGRDLDGHTFDGGAQSERSFCGQETARFVGRI